MKKLLIFILLLPTVLATHHIFSAAIVTTELNVTSYADITRTGNDPVMESVQSDIVFVPLNSDYQSTSKMELFPSGQLFSDRARFKWYKPPIGKLEFGYHAVVDVANSAPRVKAKLPISVPRGFDQYRMPTTNIDSSDAQIMGIALKLAEGEDDLFRLVSKLAFWVKNNVDYNLSTLTADVSRPASWVLKERVGVCDELTSLFIALSRSLDIPARFVSGVSYTNSPLFPENWGPHSWAEVYFPSVGWLPFDPTFGQFGWVDPGHVKLKESRDPQEPTSVVEWRARDLNVEVHDLDISASVVNVKQSIPYELHFVPSVLHPKVGFGSHNLVIVDVENLADYYVAAELALSQVTDVEMLDPSAQPVILSPREKARLFWKVKVKDNLDRGLQYEIPVRISSVRNDESKTSFATSVYETTYSLKDIENAEANRELFVSRNLELSCIPPLDVWKADEASVTCVVQNKAGARDVEICLRGCHTISLAANEKRELTLKIPSSPPGKQEVRIIASSDGEEARAVLTITRLDDPSIKVKDIVIPESVVYGESFDIKFLLSRDSISIPKDVSVIVAGGGAKTVLDFGDLPYDQEVIVTVNSKQLDRDRPVFNIEVSFKGRDKPYKTKTSSSTRIVGFPIWKRFIGWFASFFR